MSNAMIFVREYFTMKYRTAATAIISALAPPTKGRAPGQFPGPA